MNKYMELADRLAKENVVTDNGGPFGAVVVKDGKIIGKGSNQVVKMKDPTAHAEVVAIRDACKNLNTFDLTGCTLYSSCYPCPMCLSATIWSNIKTVYYGNTKEDAENIGFRDDAIYKYLEKLSKEQESDMLTFIPEGREETIKTFQEFKNKSENKTMY